VSSIRTQLRLRRRHRHRHRRHLYGYACHRHHRHRDFVVIDQDAVDVVRVPRQHADTLAHVRHGGPQSDSVVV